MRPGFRLKYAAAVATTDALDADLSFTGDPDRAQPIDTRARKHVHLNQVWTRNASRKTDDAGRADLKAAKVRGTAYPHHPRTGVCTRALTPMFNYWPTGGAFAEDTDIPRDPLGGHGCFAAGETHQSGTVNSIIARGSGSTPAHDACCRVSDPIDSADTHDTWPKGAAPLYADSALTADTGGSVRVANDAVSRIA